MRNEHGLLIGMAAWALRLDFRGPSAFPAGCLASPCTASASTFSSASMNTYQNLAPADIPASTIVTRQLVYGSGKWLGTSSQAGSTSTHQATVDPTTGRAVRETNWGKFWLWPCIAVTVSLIVFLDLLPRSRLDP